MLRLVLFYASNKSHYLNKSSSLPLGKLCKKSGLGGKDVLYTISTKATILITNVYCLNI
jgi:hypothetical protein